MKKKKLSISVILIIAIIVISAIVVANKAYLSGFAASGSAYPQITSAVFSGACSETSAGKIEVTVINIGSDKELFYLWADCKAPYIPPTEQLFSLEPGTEQTKSIAITAPNGKKEAGTCSVLLAGPDGTEVLEIVPICGSGATIGSSSAPTNDPISIALPDCSAATQTEGTYTMQVKVTNNGPESYYLGASAIDSACDADSQYVLEYSEAPILFNNSAVTTLLIESTAKPGPEAKCTLQLLGENSLSEYSKDFTICGTTPVGDIKVSDDAANIENTNVPASTPGLSVPELSLSSIPACSFTDRSFWVGAFGGELYRVGELSIDVENTGTDEREYNIVWQCDAPYSLRIPTLSIYSTKLKIAGGKTGSTKLSLESSNSLSVQGSCKIGVAGSNEVEIDLETINICAPVQKTCGETPSGQCSATKPKYCDNGNLVDKCNPCKCPSATDICQADGTCKAAPVITPVNTNQPAAEVDIIVEPNCNLEVDNCVPFSRTGANLYDDTDTRCKCCPEGYTFNSAEDKCLLVSSAGAGTVTLCSDHTVESECTSAPCYWWASDSKCHDAVESQQGDAPGTTGSVIVNAPKIVSVIAPLCQADGSIDMIAMVETNDITGVVIIETVSCQDNSYSYQGDARLQKESPGLGVSAEVYESAPNIDRFLHHLTSKDGKKHTALCNYTIRDKSSGKIIDNTTFIACQAGVELDKTGRDGQTQFRCIPGLYFCDPGGTGSTGNNKRLCYCSADGKGYACNTCALDSATNYLGSCVMDKYGAPYCSGNSPPNREVNIVVTGIQWTDKSSAGFSSYHFESNRGPGCGDGGSGRWCNPGSVCVDWDKKDCCPEGTYYNPTQRYCAKACCKAPGVLNGYNCILAYVTTDHGQTATFSDGKSCVCCPGGYTFKSQLQTCVKNLEDGKMWSDKAGAYLDKNSHTEYKANQDACSKSEWA